MATPSLTSNEFVCCRVAGAQACRALMNLGCGVEAPADDATATRGRDKAAVPMISILRILLRESISPTALVFAWQRPVPRSTARTVIFLLRFYFTPIRYRIRLCDGVPRHRSYAASA